MEMPLCLISELFLILETYFLKLKKLKKADSLLYTISWESQKKKV